MTIDPSGLPTEYANAMATIIGIYAIAIVVIILLIAMLLGIAKVMDYVRAKRFAAGSAVDRDDSGN